VVPRPRPELREARQAERILRLRPDVSARRGQKRTARRNFAQNDHLFLCGAGERGRDGGCFPDGRREGKSKGENRKVGRPNRKFQGKMEA
jgi:hypothetical protein